MDQGNGVIEAVRRALGRTEPLTAAPIPPAINEPLVRLVHSDIGLPELFADRAKANKMGVEALYLEELHAKLVEFLKANDCRLIALPASPFLEKIGVPQALRDAGFGVRLWPEMTLDELYDFDCGVTDVWRAVAETGSLVMRTSPEHGRALSLLPRLHVAILQPKDFLPDLVDLFQLLTADGGFSNVVIISGPSKTADIEMNLVTGVHGPGVVQLYVLQ